MTNTATKAAIDTVAESEITTLPLSALALAKENVRKCKPSQIDAMASDIVAHGLLQSVIAYQDGKLHKVCGGGRRYRALRQLEDAGTITGDYAVPVRVIDRADAVELSFAENAQREDLHPADAVRAFAAMKKIGRSAEDIAARFGFSAGYVRKMLCLAGLDASILTAFASDEIDYDTAKALSLAPSKAEQKRLYKTHGGNAWRIKAAMFEEKVKTDHRMFVFVTEEAYREAGGTTTGDLFENETYADDPELVLSLADAKMRAIADDLKADGWKSVATDLDETHFPYRSDRVTIVQPTQKREPNEAEAARLAKIEAAITAEIDLLDDGEDQWSPAIGRLENAKQRIEQGLFVYADKAKSTADLSVIVDYNGMVSLQALTVAERSKSGQEGETAPSIYSGALCDQMEALRTKAVRMDLADDPKRAFGLFAAELVSSALGDRYSFDCASAITFQQPHIRSTEEIDPDDGVHAHEDLAALFSAILGDYGESTSASEAVLQLPIEQQMQLVGLAYAASIKTGADIDTDTKRRWTPGPAFFGKLRKNVLLDLIAEQDGREAAANVAKMKKDALAEETAKRLTNWMPEPLHTSSE